MSYGLYVGKNHTADGLAYLAGYGDEPSSHWLEIFPRKKHKKGSRITVGVTADAELPGKLSQIPQTAVTARNIRVEYTHYLGVPAPLTNGGLNEHGVAVRDIWSPSRAELVEMTPTDQTGPNYSDLARIVIERAPTARQGVELIGELIAKHGYSTYGGNSHLIADANEGWVVIEFAGGKGLWAAERLGPGSIRASRPGYIGDIATTGKAANDFLHSPNLISFAIEQGWYNPLNGNPFNVNKVYGDGKLRWKGVRWIEGEMKKRAARRNKIGIEDMMWAIRTPKLTGDTAGYGQVVPLHNPEHDNLRLLWHTAIGAVAAPFVPVFMGVDRVPEEFRQHRYLTSGESTRFVDTRHAISDGPEFLSQIPQGIESTRSAVLVFKRLLYLMQQHPEFLEEVTPLWQAFERQRLSEVPSVLKSAGILFEKGEPELARDHLTYYTNTELRNALKLGETLAESLEAKTRLLHGISDDPTPKSFDQIW